jgi:hypothetical protein
MNRKFYTFAILIIFLITSAQHVVAQQLTAGAFSGTVENLLGVRYRNVRPVDASQVQANFIGIPDLGSNRNSPANSTRSDQSLNYGTTGSYTFSITYNPGTNTFECVTTIGSNSFTNSISNVSGRLIADGKVAAPATINYFGLAVRTNNSASTISVSNLNIDGIPVNGTYSRSNSSGESQWYGISAALNNGFTVTGTATLSGNFANSAEAQRIQFFFGNTSSSAGSLPVTWGNFSVKRNNNSSVQLNWETIQEINASHFDVERSEDGIRFTNAGMVKAFGNTQNKTAYTFTDNFATGPVYYYRLAQYDFDGKKSYSAIVKSGNSNKKTLFATNGNSVRIQFFESGSRQINLINSSGALVKQITVNTMQSDIDVIGLAKGIYIIQVSDLQGSKEVFRFLR